MVVANLVRPLVAELHRGLDPTSIIRLSVRRRSDDMEKSPKNAADRVSVGLIGQTRGFGRQYSCQIDFAEPRPVTQVVRLHAKREKKDWQEYFVARK